MSWRASTLLTYPICCEAWEGCAAQDTLKHCCETIPLNVAVSSGQAKIRKTGSIKRKFLPLPLPQKPKNSAFYPRCRVRIPIEGSGFLSGGRTRYNQGVIFKTWLNLSCVQVWEVEWTDGQIGELTAP